MKKGCLLLLLLLFFPLLARAETSAALTAQRTDTPTGYRLDYLDAQGAPALATDKGYATVVRVVTGGHTTEEAFFDAQGAPIAVSGAAGRAYLYEDGVLTQITYLDAARKPILNSSGYAIVKRTVDAAGHIVHEKYFDTNGEPVALRAGQYGLRRDAFDEQDRVTQYTYLDENDAPLLLTSGYATVKRSYDENGRKAVDLYFDTLGAPVALSLGQYGQRYLYNEAGKHIGTVYLDAAGQPMVNAQGYVTIRYEYDEAGSLVCSRYFDAQDRPVALSRGQYGQIHVYSGSKKVRSYFIDSEGKELFLLDQFLNQNPLLNLVVALLLVLCAAFLPRRPRLILLISYAVFILYMTLLVREPGDQKLNLHLFWSYAQFGSSDTLRNEILNNILLFIPLGALVYSLWPHPAALLVPVVFSALIEGAQLVFRLGLCELDDIVSNSLGGALGGLGAWGLGLLRRRRGRRAA